MDGWMDGWIRTHPLHPLQWIRSVTHLTTVCTVLSCPVLSCPVLYVLHTYVQVCMCMLYSMAGLVDGWMDPCNGWATISPCNGWATLPSVSIPYYKYYCATGWIHVTDGCNTTIQQYILYSYERSRYVLLYKYKSLACV